MFLQAYSTANLQLIFFENATTPQMPSYSDLWLTVNHNTCFKLPLVFWH